MMDSDTKFFVSMGMTGLGALTLLAAVFFLLAHIQCSTYSRETGFPTKISAGTCYVYKDGRWHHWDEVRGGFKS